MVAAIGVPAPELALGQRHLTGMTGGVVGDVPLVRLLAGEAPHQLPGLRHRRSQPGRHVSSRPAPACSRSRLISFSSLVSSNPAGAHILDSTYGSSEPLGSVPPRSAVT